MSVIFQGWITKRRRLKISDDDGDLDVAELDAIEENLRVGVS